MNKKALLIGINYEDHPPSLRGCINDIINMRNMLIDAYDFDPENIIMLRDDDPYRFIMPTRENILYETNKIISESENLEELWFHFSGHGSKLKNETRESILPMDYKISDGIYDTELHELIQQIKCKTMMIFDCCHSGTICNLPIQIEYDNTAYDNIKVQQYVSHNSHHQIYVFSSCKEEQTSVDTKNFMDQRVGAFTNAFIECLRKSHHNTDILTLYKNICISLIENGYTQTPILSIT